MSEIFGAVVWDVDGVLIDSEPLHLSSFTETCAHTHQSLLHQNTQRQILDLHGGHQELATTVANRFKTWQTLEQELQARRHGGEDREAQLELLRFQIAELEREHSAAVGRGVF